MMQGCKELGFFRHSWQAHTDGWSRPTNRGHGAEGEEQEHIFMSYVAIKTIRNHQHKENPSSAVSTKETRDRPFTRLPMTPDPS
jgi:hypothetical protein